MAFEILLPRLGWTMEEGTLVEWIKHDGDAIQPGDVLYTVESDKSLNEVESFDAGILCIPASSPAPGSKVPVGTVLAYIVQAGEALPVAASGDGQLVVSGKPSAVFGDPITDQHSPVSDQRSLTTAISPRARRVAAELGVDLAQLTGSGKTGRIVERDVRAAHSVAAAAAPDRRQPVIVATPIAQRMATELGVDLAELARSLPGRRIERADVERAAQRRTEDVGRLAVAGKPSSAGGAAATAHSRMPMSSTRRVIAERMAASAHTAAPVTMTTEVDATELVRLRAQLKADAPSQAAVVPTINDVLIKIVAHALKEHPALNARLDGDHIVMFDAAHIGMAVDADRGLLVVVVRDAGSKTLREIAGESRRLIERARTGSSTPNELSGGTFTITNLGMYDIDAFTPIINLPECAILGIGRIAPKHVVVDAAAEKVAIRQMMTLSLTFDHRLVDGAPAARFLQRVKQLVEQPYLWLVV